MGEEIIIACKEHLLHTHVLLIKQRLNILTRVEAGVFPGKLSSAGGTLKTRAGENFIHRF
jgi:hypothetical protein